jgi:hypothetical protein
LRITAKQMKITEPIDERLWKALNHIANFTQSRLDRLFLNIHLVLVLTEVCPNEDKYHQRGSKTQFLKIGRTDLASLRKKHLPNKKMLMLRNSWTN